MQITRIIRLRCFKLMLIVLAGFMIMATATPSSLALTIKEEKDLGRQVLIQVSKQFDFISDPEITKTIDRIGHKILAASGPQPFEYHFYVILSLIHI